MKSDVKKYNARKIVLDDFNDSYGKWASENTWGLLYWPNVSPYEHSIDWDKIRMMRICFRAGFMRGRRMNDTDFENKVKIPRVMSDDE